MSRFVEGQDRSQVTLLPECLDDYIAEDNPVRVVDAFIGELDLIALGFPQGKALAAAGNDQVTIITLPDANHLFQSAVTGAVGEYGSLEQTFTPDFLPTLVDWVTTHAGARP